MGDEASSRARTPSYGRVNLLLRAVEPSSFLACFSYNTGWRLFPLVCGVMEIPVGEQPFIDFVGVPVSFSFCRFLGLAPFFFSP